MAKQQLQASGVKRDIAGTNSCKQSHPGCKAVRPFAADNQSCTCSHTYTHQVFVAPDQATQVCLFRLRLPMTVHIEAVDGHSSICQLLKHCTEQRET